MLNQEYIVFGVVGICLIHLLWRASRHVCGKVLSEWLLKRGWVSLAMKVRKGSSSSPCHSCQCS